jgi:hypothetical protein
MTKRCHTCEKWKERSEFYRCAKCPDGLQYDCKQCSKDRIMAARRADPTLAAKRKQTSQRWSKYDVTPADYKRMMADQDGRCGICGVVLPSKVDIDHNHVTGAVRGLLCHNCNTCHFPEDPKLLRRAADWFERMTDYRSRRRLLD